MFTEIVAIRTVTRAKSRPKTLSLLPASATGSQIGAPYTACEPEVTSTESRANAVIVVGRPRVCPQTWARCPAPKRVKSGMLRDRVAQDTRTPPQ